MRSIKLLAVGAVVALLSGCAVYGPPPGAVYAAPGYYQPPPVYYGPSVGIGVYGGYGRGYGYGRRHW